NRGEKVLELSISKDLVFVQTNQANFHVFDGESGRRMWSTNLGNFSVDAQPASSNSTTVFVTNSNIIHALDRTDGRIKWSGTMEHLPASATSCDEDHVYVGLRGGKLLCYDAKTGAALWSFSTRADISSRAEPAGRVVAFASNDGKVYTSRAEV
ncbi:MAG TPA: PQQ-binding-like beta-propeller repeat protein, partial [Isosphaeraceae bacterium]